MIPDALTPFQRWIVDAAREVGATVPAEVDPLGLTFEAEGRTARILPHTDEALAVIEVEAISLKDLSESGLGRLAVQLLRLNHEARFEHGWSIVLDERDRLRVTTSVVLTDTRGPVLAEVLYDGIARAAALSAVTTGLIRASAVASEPEASVPAGFGAIRG